MRIIYISSCRHPNVSHIYLTRRLFLLCPIFLFVTAPDARKRSPEFHSGDEERGKWQKRLPEVARGSENESIQKLSEDPAHYAKPSNAVPLPSPSWNTIPPRFDMSSNGSFSYIGREKFALVWDAWLKIKADVRHRQAIYIYGTRGYGKSHILAALACLLVRTKERVVYLPDCRAMLQEPLGYLRKALLFAFADSSSSDYREHIYECEDIEALADFLHELQKRWTVLHCRSIECFGLRTEGGG